MLALTSTIACSGVLAEERASVDAGPAVAAPPCDELKPTDSDGHHRPGEDCLMCHRQGGEGMPYSIAGTLYTGNGGAMTVPGATIHIIDANGMDAIAVSQTNGNFWSTDPITCPAVAFVSLCPKVGAMVTPLAAPDASCNRAGCHTAGFRVH
jgi:hypothetical protein